MKYKGSITDAERGLRVAARFATYLLEQDIRNPKTRSCMMAKVFSEEYRMDSDEDKRIFFKGILHREWCVCIRVFPNKELPL